MTRSAQAIGTRTTDFPGNIGADARVARCQWLAEVTDAEDPLVRIKLHRWRTLLSRPTVIPMGFDRPAWRRFGPPPYPRTVPASGVPGGCPPTENGSMERINRLTSCGCDTVRQLIILFAGRR